MALFYNQVNSTACGAAHVQPAQALALAHGECAATLCAGLGAHAHEWKRLVEQRAITALGAWDEVHGVGVSDGARQSTSSAASKARRNS